MINHIISYEEMNKLKEEFSIIFRKSDPSDKKWVISFGDPDPKESKEDIFFWVIATWHPRKKEFELVPSRAMFDVYLNDARLKFKKKKQKKRIKQIKKDF